MPGVFMRNQRLRVALGSTAAPDCAAVPLPWTVDVHTMADVFTPSDPQSASLLVGCAVENWAASVYWSVPVELASVHVVPPPVDAALAPCSVYVSMSPPESLVTTMADVETVDTL